MENEGLIKQFLTSLDSSVGSLSPDISTLISTSFEDRINETSDPLQQIAISNGYAYVLVSLCFAYLKAQGVNTSNHPIMKDLERVKSYMNRAKLAEEGKEEVKVDTSVAKRFLQGVLGGKPAISEENFNKGKHTKFEDEKKDEEKDKDLAVVRDKSVAAEIRDKLKNKSKKKDKKSRQDKVSKK
ncbi:CYFA0S11e00540g1_1 [Cyberlindnera fabianii]|uniref:Exosome complex protein n=1 Tax=Cyberlindnera fabianii TaxID=36022 RepID=A0A061B896_CYBFA|nr:Nuclear nucleic acid-binding protein C1D [Cyberlindnera fabianii]CDR43128.1 CYFA0S11e00540g1_1 [Cyberlindnera fabianii]